MDLTTMENHRRTNRQREIGKKKAQGTKTEGGKGLTTREKREKERKKQHPSRRAEYERGSTSKSGGQRKMGTKVKGGE